MMWWDGSCGAGYPGSGWGMMHGIIPLVFIVALVLGVFLLVRVMRTGSAPSSGRPTALSTLEERYAKGEIEREEYLEKKQDLGA